MTAAKAEAEANQLKSASLTPELIQMTEAEARLKHGWVTVQGADATVVDANGKEYRLLYIENFPQEIASISSR